MSMTAVKEGQPFSATYNKLRGTAGGMTNGKSDTEFKDNSFDGGSQYSNMKILVLEETVDGVKEHRIYIIQWDKGNGCPSLPHLYGLGETMPRKMDDESCGLFNHGHTAAIAFHNPEFVYSESRCDGKFGSLMFKSAEFAAEIDKSEEDLRKANVTRYMKSNDERLPSQETLLKICVDGVKDITMKKQLEDIQNGTALSYMLNILKLKKGAELPDDYYKAFTANERMYYYKSLKAGRTIALETSDGKMEIANAANAIDPLSDRTKFKVLESTFVVKRSPITSKLIAKLTLKNAGQNESRDLYIHYDTNDGRRKYPVVTEVCPAAEWKDEAPVLITLTGSTNAISETEANAQLKRLYNQSATKGRAKKTENGLSGSDFKSVDDIRGVSVEFVHRILGLPYWRKGPQDTFGWGTERNSGHPRCCVRAEGDKGRIAEMLGLQSNKHNTDFDKCDPIILRYLFCIFGVVVHRYTTCTLNENNNPITKNGKNTSWDLTEIVSHIMGRPISRIAPTPPPVQPVIPLTNAFGARPKQPVAPAVPAPVAPAPGVPAPVAPAPVVVAPGPIPIEYNGYFAYIHPKVKAENPTFSPQQITTEIARLWNIRKAEIALGLVQVPAPAPAPVPAPVPVPVPAPEPALDTFRVDRNDTHFIVSEGDTEYLRVAYTRGIDLAQLRQFEPMFKKWIQELKSTMA